MAEKINERVDVITIFRAAPRPKTEIYKVSWRGREYRIKEQAMHYTQRDGRKLLHKFSVSTGSTNLFLSYDTENLQWMLEAITDC